MNKSNVQQNNLSSITAHVIRLKPYQDLYQEIFSYLKNNNINAGFIMTCVGSLRKINIRLANATEYIVEEGNKEIISLVGCISIERSHIHIGLSDEKGKTLGGHLMPEGNLVNTTAELVIGVLNDLNFGIEYDKETGWNELCISKKQDI